MALKLKLIFGILFLLFFVSNKSISAVANNGYKIKITVAGIKDTMCYLAYYYGDKQYIRDSSMANSKGEFTFTGKEELPGGIYLVVLPGKRFFEIIVDKDQAFSWEAEMDKLDDFNFMKTSGSEDNSLFLDYTKFITIRGKNSERLKKNSASAKENGDSLLVNSIKDSMMVNDKQVLDYKKDFVKKHPDSFLTIVFKGMFDPDIPEIPVLSNGRPDSTFRFRFYKQHFWDNIDFSDDRIVRTPVYHNKLKNYIMTLTLQTPDSIIAAADMLIERSRGAKELFKYTVWFVTYNYETSNIMGMDEVFVHMAEKYYMTKEAFWVDEATLYRITDRAMTTKPLLLGRKAPNLVLKDLHGKYQSLHDVDAKYTIVVFWNPDCGHCKKEMPVLDSLYLQVHKKGVEVYAVCAESELDKWRDYIKEHNLNWINVSDSTFQSGFKKLYDIQSTPIIYILDSKKQIIAKKISAEQAGEILENRFKNDLILHD